MDRSLFITGGSGFLGNNWINYIKSYDQYFLINQKHIPNQDKKKFFYKNDINQLSNFIIKNNIDTILHFAAITDLEICESDFKKCLNSNFDLTKELVLIAKSLNLKFLFISSDQVYSGNKSYCSESDKVFENNNYARSKIFSEDFIKNNLEDFLIIRTNFFGTGGQNKSFFDFVYKNLEVGNKINLWGNIFFNPINVITLVNMINELLIKDCKGIYNICSDNKISKFRFGQLIAKKFNFNESCITEVEYKNLSLNRPFDMSMSNQKIKNELNIVNLIIENEVDKITNVI